MKKIILLLAFIVGSMHLVHAQNHDDMPPLRKEVREKLKTYRVAFFTERLELTTTEAEKLWPIYNRFLEDRESIMKDLRNLRPDKIEGKSEAELKAVINKHFELKQQLLNKEKLLAEELQKFLPLEKVIKMQMVERAFKREIIHKMREHRNR